MMADWTKDIDPGAYGKSNRNWGTLKGLIALHLQQLAISEHAKNA